MLLMYKFSLEIQVAAINVEENQMNARRMHSKGEFVRNRPVDGVSVLRK